MSSETQPEDVVTIARLQPEATATDTAPQLDLSYSRRSLGSVVRGESEPGILRRWWQSYRGTEDHALKGQLRWTQERQPRTGAVRATAALALGVVSQGRRAQTLLLKPGGQSQPLGGAHSQPTLRPSPTMGTQGLSTPGCHQQNTPRVVERPRKDPCAWKGSGAVVARAAGY